MAIASVIVQVEPGHMDEIEAILRLHPDVTYMGRVDGTTLVAVIEGPSGEMAGAERWIKTTPGVLSVSAAFVSIEDELEEAAGAGL